MLNGCLGVLVASFIQKCVKVSITVRSQLRLETLPNYKVRSMLSLQIRTSWPVQLLQKQRIFFSLSLSVTASVGLRPAVMTDGDGCPPSCSRSLWQKQLKMCRTNIEGYFSLLVDGLLWKQSRYRPQRSNNADEDLLSHMQTFSPFLFGPWMCMKLTLMFRRPPRTEIVEAKGC